jgi:hypothetical protein
LNETAGGKRVGFMDELALTVPVREIVMSALRELRDDAEHDYGLDRDEAYLLDRLERGWDLTLVAPDG